MREMLSDLDRAQDRALPFLSPNLHRLNGSMVGLMKRQCECGNQADEIVFGPQHRYEPLPQPFIPAGSLVSSWRFVVPEEPPWANTLGPEEVCD